MYVFMIMCGFEYSKMMMKRQVNDDGSFDLQMWGNRGRDDESI